MILPGNVLLPELKQCLKLGSQLSLFVFWRFLRGRHALSWFINEFRRHTFTP